MSPGASSVRSSLPVPAINIHEVATDIDFVLLNRLLVGIKQDQIGNTEILGFNLNRLIGQRDHVNHGWIADDYRSERLLETAESGAPLDGANHIALWFNCAESCNVLLRPFGSRYINNRR